MEVEVQIPHSRQETSLTSQSSNLASIQQRVPANSFDAKGYKYIGYEKNGME